MFATLIVLASVVGIQFVATVGPALAQDDGTVAAFCEGDSPAARWSFPGASQITVIVNGVNFGALPPAGNATFTAFGAGTYNWTATPDVGSAVSGTLTCPWSSAEPGWPFGSDPNAANRIAPNAGETVAVYAFPLGKTDTGEDRGTWVEIWLITPLEIAPLWRGTLDELLAELDHRNAEGVAVLGDSAGKFLNATRSGNVVTLTNASGQTVRTFRLSNRASQAIRRAVSAPNSHTSASPTSVIVQVGESMATIAKRLGVNLDALIRANPQKSDPDLVHPGEELQVPR